MDYSAGNKNMTDLQIQQILELKGKKTWKEIAKQVGTTRLKVEKIISAKHLQKPKKKYIFDWDEK